MSEQIYCEACGFNNVEIKETYREVQVPFSKPISYAEKVTICHNCGASIRIDSDTQEVVEQRVFKSAVESIPALLEDLNRREYSDARIERCFDLGKGTIAKWKKKQEITPEVVSLVRFIYSMPWLIRIAEDGYNLDDFLEKSHIIKMNLL